MSRPTERRAPTHFWLLAFLLLTASFYLLTLRPGHDWGDDFAQYIHHAKNIALGLDYTQTGYIWNPRFPELGPPTYPPVFPLLLAPIYAARGLDLGAMKVIVTLCFVAALYFIALTFRPVLRPRYVLVLLILIGLNPYFWRLKDSVLSDLPFLLFIYLSLCLIARHPGPGRLRARTILFATVLGASCYLAYGTRALGVILIPSLLLTDWLRWRRITSISVVAVATFVVMAAVQSTVTHWDTGYASVFRLEPHRIATNFAEYASYLSGLWSNAWWRPGDLVLLVLFGMLGAVGFWRRVRSGRVTELEVFAVLYALAILPWFEVQGRYLVPLMPLYIGYALVTVQGAASHRWRGTLLLGLVALAALGFFSEYLVLMKDRGPEGVGSANARLLWRAVERNTDSSAVVVFQKPRALALFTDRHTTGMQRSGDDRDLWDYLSRVGASFAILGPSDSNFVYQARLRRLIAEYPGRFQLIYRNPDFSLYRIRARGERVNSLSPSDFHRIPVKVHAIRVERPRSVSYP